MFLILIKINAINLQLDFGHDIAVGAEHGKLVFGSGRTHLVLGYATGELGPLFRLHIGALKITQISSMKLKRVEARNRVSFSKIF